MSYRFASFAPAAAPAKAGARPSLYRRKAAKAFRSAQKLSACLPLNLAGALQRIHGPFSGDSNRTVISVNNLPAKLLIESPRGAYCFLPADLKPGLADWTIHDEQRSVRLRSWVLALQMSADKLKLMKGESTAFHVYIKGVETIPQEAWFGSGDVPDFIDPAIIRKFLPDFQAAFAIAARRAGADAGKHVHRHRGDERRKQSWRSLLATARASMNITAPSRPRAAAALTLMER